MKWFTATTFRSKSWQLQILCVISVGSTFAKRTFSCIRQIDKWFFSSMLTDLLGDLTIIIVHGHPILISKIDICRTYMSIHLRRVMASSRFIDS